MSSVELSVFDNRHRSQCQRTTPGGWECLAPSFDPSRSDPSATRVDDCIGRQSRAGKDRRGGFRAAHVDRRAGGAARARRLRNASDQSSDHAGRPGSGLSPRDPPAVLHGSGHLGHPRVFRGRHARGSVLVWRSRVSPAHRDHPGERRKDSTARRRRRHHRGLRRQFHGAGLWAVRRQAVRGIRATLPEARRAGRDHRPRLQSCLLDKAVGAELGALGAGGRPL